jgi:hypothetical protein
MPVCISVSQMFLGMPLSQQTGQDHTAGVLFVVTEDFDVVMLLAVIR